MSTLSIVQNVPYTIRLNYPNPGGFPPATIRIFWTLKRNGQVVPGINFPSSASFVYEPNHPSSILTGVVLNPTGSSNIALEEGDELSVRVEARNAVSSVPVFLEASAIVTRLLPNVILQPITLRKQNEINVILTNQIAFDTDSDPTGTVLVVGGPQSQNTTPQSEWEDVSLREYVWKRGLEVVSTSPTYTITEQDKDKGLSVEVIARNATSSARRTFAIEIGNPVEEIGWTVLTPSADSRLIYVATNGDDVAASGVKNNRGYYLPSDPEIGPDPTNPVGPIVAYASLQESTKRVRMSVCNGEDANGFPTYGSGGPGGFPDWLLIKRGSNYPTNPTVWAQAGDQPATQQVYNLGQLLGGNHVGWNQAKGTYHYSAGVWRGVSANEPMVLTAWGSTSDPIPAINGFQFASHTRHVRVVSIDLFSVSAKQSDQGTLIGGDILIEDCRVRTFGGISVCRWDYDRGLVIRRSVCSGSWSSSSHNQGLFVGGPQIVTIEECIFDRNGYKDDPFDPSTWTRGVASGGLPAGTGLQPNRTFYDRNIYVATGNGVNHTQVTLRGSIISRGGGGGSVQMRQGGISERNVFMWNEDVGYVISGPGGVFRSNLVLHDDHMLPPGGWGKGLAVFNSEPWNNQGYGWSLDPNPRYIVDDSIFTHFHRGSNGGGLLDVYNASTEHYDNGSNVGSLLNGRVAVTNNALYRSQSDALKFASYGTWDDATIGGNQIAISNGTVFNSAPIHLTSVAEKGSVPYSIGDSASGGNLYWSQSATPFGGGRVFDQWQALRSGFESESQFLSDFAAFKAAAGWTAPERDIVSYMQSIDPAFVPNEDVTTDDGVPADKRRPNAPKVWEVLSDPALDSFYRMSVDQAKLAARRYHAFLVFIERAKANRKGAWDPAYTADALNNYIRAGFGKDPVGGSYDDRPIEDILLEYFE